MNTDFSNQEFFSARARPDPLSSDTMLDRETGLASVSIRVHPWLKYFPAASFRSGLLVGVLSLVVAFAAVAGDDIAEVRTVDDLQKVKPVALAGGGEIRLGLAESGPDGGPWKLLYGLVKAGDGRNHVQRLGDDLQPLGPVFFKVKSPRPVEAALKRAEALMELEKEEINRGGMDLYCARVMTAFPGKYELAVQDAAGRILLKTAFEVSRVRSAYWLELAGPDDKALAKQPFECVPRFDGSEAIARMGKKGLKFGGAVFQFSELAKPGNRAPLANDLPGGIPLDGRLESVFNQIKREPGQRPFPLLLGMDGDELVVQSVAIHMDITVVENPFLARWWLNGQPVLPEPPRTVERDEEKVKQTCHCNWEVGTVTERRWRFLLPPIFKTLRVGDHIRMQVLYCPQGFELLSEAEGGGGQEMLREIQVESDTSPTVPVLSNPLELVVTDATAGKAKAKVRPGQPKLQPLEGAPSAVETVEETK